MKRLFTLALLVGLSSPCLQAQTVDLTFMLNMEYETPSESGVYIAGGGNFGDPGDNPLDDSDMDGIWTITIPVEVGFSSFYTFTNGACPDYSCKENLAGQPCGDPDSFNDRFVGPVQNDTTVLICFGQCTTDLSCIAPAEPVDVTFSVDMGNETILGPIYITGGGIDNWCGTCTAMTDDDTDGVHEVTLSLVPGTYEYKYNNAGWDGTEILDPTEDGACTLTTGDFTNRIVTVDAGGPVMLGVNCFAGCGACVTSVDDFELNGYSLYPTPVVDFTVLRFDKVHSGMRTMRLYDVTGALTTVSEVDGSETQVRIDLSSVQAGVYLLGVEAEGIESVRRLVVQR